MLRTVACVVDVLVCVGVVEEVRYMRGSVVRGI